MIDLQTLPRLQRAGWTALTALLAVLLLTGMWSALDPDPAILTGVVDTSTENQIGVWTVGVLLLLGGLWAVSAMLVRNTATIVHAGLRVMWDVPLVVTLLIVGGFLLAVSAPFTGFMFQALSTGVMLSALGRWIDGAVIEHRSGKRPAKR
ncbi:MAG TPA: hypothetical protein VF885_12775 [Arthrobacter sp.]